MTRNRDEPDHLDRARQLRRNMTFPEKRLWRVLRDRRLAGLKFRRQVPVCQFVADFACIETQLIIEVDGESHTGRLSADQRREELLRGAGWRVVRVSNDDVLQNLEGVLSLIVTAAGLDVDRWRNGEYGQLPEGWD